MTGKLLLCVALMAALGTASAQEPDKTVSGVLETGQSTITKAMPNLKAAENTENIYSYCNHDDKLNGIGVGGKSHIQCGALFPAQAFEAVKGNRVTAIRIKMYETNKQINQRIWIRETSLESNPVYAKAVTFSKPKEWQEFKLETPYVIGDKDFYIGLDLEVTEAAETQGEKFPVGANLIPRPNSNFMNIDHYRWDDYTVDGLGALMIEAVVDGKVVTNDVALLDVKETFAVKKENRRIEGRLMNCTRDYVQSVDVAYDVDGISRTVNVPLEFAVRQMEDSPFSFDAEMPDKAGVKSLKVNIVKVNGKTDGYMDNNAATTPVKVLNQKAQRRIVMEEITGTWCGFCIVGAAAFERLQNDYKDSIICIAAHGPNPTDDVFTCGGYIPLMKLAGDKYPRAFINRKGEMFQSYFGRTKEFYGVRYLVDEELAEYVPADVKVADVELIDNGTKLRMTGSATFYMDMDDCPYQFAYALLEDKLTGTQHNELSGNAISDPYLKKYTEMPQDVEDFEFNDVARGIYPYEGVEGSLTGKVVSGKAKTHQYTVYLTQTKVENWDNCRLVVMLIDQRDGSIVNANQVSLKGMKGTGICTAEKQLKADMAVADGKLNVCTDGDATLEVYSPQGVLLMQKAFSGQTSVEVEGWKGLYIVRVNDGYHVAVEKFVF